MAVLELQEGVARRQALHVLSHPLAGPQKHHPALILPQGAVPAVRQTKWCNSVSINHPWT